MKKLLKITTIVLVVCVAFSGILLPGCTGSGSTPEYGPEIGKLAPDFTLTGLDGQEVSLSDFRGEPVLYQNTDQVAENICCFRFNDCYHFDLKYPAR